MSKLTIELTARRNNKPTRFELKGKPIKHCPFCFGDDIHLVESDGMHWCCCTTCGVEGPVRDNRIHATMKWQNRKVSK